MQDAPCLRVAVIIRKWKACHYHFLCILRVRISGKEYKPSAASLGPAAVCAVSGAVLRLCPFAELSLQNLSLLFFFFFLLELTAAGRSVFAGKRRPAVLGWVSTILCPQLCLLPCRREGSSAATKSDVAPSVWAGCVPRRAFLRKSLLELEIPHCCAALRFPLEMLPSCTSAKEKRKGLVLEHCWGEAAVPFTHSTSACKTHAAVGQA